MLALAERQEVILRCSHPLSQHGAALGKQPCVAAICTAFCEQGSIHALALSCNVKCCTPLLFWYISSHAFRQWYIADTALQERQGKSRHTLITFHKDSWLCRLILSILHVAAAWHAACQQIQNQYVQLRSQQHACQWPYTTRQTWSYMIKGTAAHRQAECALRSLQDICRTAAAHNTRLQHGFCRTVTLQWPEQPPCRNQ